MFVLLAAPALALSLSLQSESTPWPGVTLREYRTSSPSTNTFVALVDLCEANIHVDATQAPDDTASTGSWASDRGVQLATNGDFYKTSPVRVYGDAVGTGVRWPTDQSGLDGDYSGEWYYGHYGWIAFGPDRVDYTHTEWVKENLSVADGWAPTTVRPTPPSGTLALVSGFPELVIAGAAVDCTSPTASSCFTDRSDMRDRNPRTAMGLTEDKQTLILAVVDGRTSDSAGMYGEELASLMDQLGAYVAFNLDGGGSSQMWRSGTGYLNDYDGNNSGSGLRSVANHWGVFAGGVAEGMPTRPGHCVTAEPCGVVPAEGGTVDEEGACFQRFGPMEYWRSESTGDGGHLYWTNAWESDAPSNWAWWQLHLADAGSYRVEVNVSATYGVGDAVSYVVRAGGVDHEITLDQGASSGWRSLGEYTFAEGGDQWVALYDATDDASSNEHITADAVRLVRLDLPTDTGADDTGPVDTGRVDTGPGDSAADSAADSATPDGPDDTALPDAGPGALVPFAEGGCGCHGAAGGGGGFLAALLGGVVAMRRRARR